jgi:hypothetical protein
MGKLLAQTLADSFGVSGKFSPPAIVKRSRDFAIEFSTLYNPE